MRNANQPPFLRPRTKDALLVGLFWLLLVGSAAGTGIFLTRLITWTWRHLR